MKPTRIPRSSLMDTRLMFARMIDAGVGPDEVMGTLGLGRSTYFKWKNLHLTGGVEALGTAAPERPRSYVLSDEQLAQLISWLSHKNPDQFQFDFQLWTRKIVAQLLADRFDVRMTPQGCG